MNPEDISLDSAWIERASLQSSASITTVGIQAKGAFVATAATHRNIQHQTWVFREHEVGMFSDPTLE